MARPLRDDLYGAMHAALASNGGFIYRGADRQSGPQAGLGTLMRLKKWGWIRLVHARVVTPGTGQIRHEKAGGWITPLGRAALRDEVLRRGAAMPDRLARRTSRPAACPAAPVATPDRPAAPVTTPSRRATRAITPDRPAAPVTTPDHAAARERMATTARELAELTAAIRAKNAVPVWHMRRPATDPADHDPSALITTGGGRSYDDLLF